jgi:hypothetical protein
VFGDSELAFKGMFKRTRGIVIAKLFRDVSITRDRAVCSRRPEQDLVRFGTARAAVQRDRPDSRASGHGVSGVGLKSGWKIETRMDDWTMNFSPSVFSQAVVRQVVRQLAGVCPA